jgi:hypothetical protein
MAAQAGTDAGLGTGEGDSAGLGLGVGLGLELGLGVGLELEWLGLGCAASGPLAVHPATATRRHASATPVLTGMINEQKCADVTPARLGCTAPRIGAFTDLV